MKYSSLIIGCGNNYKNHSEIHDKNSFTIDENIRLNPSLVCCFGKENVNTIPEKSFSKIVFEGLYPIAINSLIGISELKRISTETVHIQVTMIEDNQVIILSERKNLKSKYISTFLLFQMTYETENTIEKMM